MINFSRELLMKLRAAGVRLDDVRYVDLYADYAKMRRDGDKVSYVTVEIRGSSNAADNRCSVITFIIMHLF